MYVTEKLTVLSVLSLQEKYLFVFTNFLWRAVWEEQDGRDGLWRLCKILTETAQEMVNDEYF
jgi:hypothetical protein